MTLQMTTGFLLGLLVGGVGAFILATMITAGLVRRIGLAHEEAREIVDAARKEAYDKLLGVLTKTLDDALKDPFDFTPPNAHYEASPAPVVVDGAGKFRFHRPDGGLHGKQRPEDDR